MDSLPQRKREKNRYSQRIRGRDWHTGFKIAQPVNPADRYAPADFFVGPLGVQYIIYTVLHSCPVERPFLREVWNQRPVINILCEDGFKTHVEGMIYNELIFLARNSSPELEMIRYGWHGSVLRHDAERYGDGYVLFD